MPLQASKERADQRQQVLEDKYLKAQGWQICGPPKGKGLLRNLWFLYGGKKGTNNSRAHIEGSIGFAILRTNSQWKSGYLCIKIPMGTVPRGWGWGHPSAEPTNTQWQPLKLWVPKQGLAMLLPNTVNIKLNSAAVAELQLPEP